MSEHNLFPEKRDRDHYCTGITASTSQNEHLQTTQIAATGFTRNSD